MSFKSLDNLLNSRGEDPLENLVHRAQKMDALVVQLRRGLKGPGAREIRSANVRDGGELVVVASSSAWAAKLRFDADRLMMTARRCGHEVTTCRVRVER